MSQVIHLWERISEEKREKSIRDRVIKEYESIVPWSVFIDKNSQVYKEIGLYPWNIISIIPQRWREHKIRYKIFDRWTNEKRKLTKVEFLIVWYAVYESDVQKDPIIQLLSIKKVYYTYGDRTIEQEVFELWPNKEYVTHIPYFQWHNWERTLENEFWGSREIISNYGQHKVRQWVKSTVDWCLNLLQILKQKD